MVTYYLVLTQPSRMAKIEVQNVILPIKYCWCFRNPAITSWQKDTLSPLLSGTIKSWVCNPQRVGCQVISWVSWGMTGSPRAPGCAAPLEMKPGLECLVSWNWNWWMGGYIHLGCPCTRLQGVFSPRHFLIEKNPTKTGLRITMAPISSLPKLHFILQVRTQSVCATILDLDLLNLEDV